jgi:hypothetical protein
MAGLSSGAQSDRRQAGLAFLKVWVRSGHATVVLSGERHGPYVRRCARLKKVLNGG